MVEPVRSVENINRGTHLCAQKTGGRASANRATRQMNVRRGRQTVLRSHFYQVRKDKSAEYVTNSSRGAPSIRIVDTLLADPRVVKSAEKSTIITGMRRIQNIL